MAFTDSPARRGQRKEGGVKRVRVSVVRVRVRVRVKDNKRGRVNPLRGTPCSVGGGSVRDHTDSDGVHPRRIYGTPSLSRVIVLE